MNLEDTKKLVNGVIENEFNHISECKEHEEVLADTELSMLQKTADELMNKLCEAAPEHAKLIDEFDSALTNYWTTLCRYYFKKGVIASATNLKFLKDISIIHLY